jgi:hypothetical protein
MAKKKRTKTSPEQWAKWEENERRLYELAERRLKEVAAHAAAPGRKPEPA